MPFYRESLTNNLKGPHLLSFPDIKKYKITSDRFDLPVVVFTPKWREKKIQRHTVGLLT